MKTGRRVAVLALCACCFSAVSGFVNTPSSAPAAASFQNPGGAVPSGSPAPPPSPGKPGRHALVVGNAAYSTLPAVAAASKEAGLMKAALEDASFDVTLIENAALSEFASGVRNFLGKIRPGDVCFFYYSGYAVQSANESFMLPVDFDAGGQSPIEDRAYPLRLLEQQLAEKGPGLIIFAIEGSRELTSLPGVILPGLAPLELEAKEILYASAAPDNQTIENAPGAELGWFTSVVAENIRKKPGVTVREVFQQARSDVKDRTNQVPQLSDNVTVDFYFHPPKPRVGQKKKDRQEYVLLSAGKFLMGCVPADTKCESHEKPQHPVTITKNFWMAATEVDVDHYQRYVTENKLKMPNKPLWGRKGNDPIVNVLWDEAQKYCVWAGGRLPTEAEWEYAARGNQDNQIYPFSSFDESRDKANFYGKQGNDQYEYTSPMKSFDPNAFQLYDMSGNVWEYVSDWYSKTYYAESPVDDPQGPKSGTVHPVRGGSFDSDPKQHLRISFRNAAPHSRALNNVGFRCVLDDTPEVRNGFVEIR